MKNLSIETLTLEEFKAVVNEIVSHQLKEHFKKEEREVKYISRKEAAKLLGCSLNTLDDWTLKGYLRQYKFGKTTIKYLRHEIEEAGPNINRRRKNGGCYV